MSLPSYTEVTNALKKTQSDFQAAQTHGLFCGIICTLPDKKTVPWEAIITGPRKNQHTHDVLQELYTFSYQQLHEFSFEFTLLLPKNNVDINIRTEALGLWCQGFVTSLQRSPLAEALQAGSEAFDALNDITEIAQVNYGDIGPTEENETAYFELVEYVRLAVLLIFHELNPQAKPSAANKNDHLH
jgi:uncharacterized protein YgfB (UPF0149 family)